MNPDTFFHVLRDLESRQSYTDREKKRLLKDVYEGMHPTRTEWEETVKLLANTCRWLPTQAEVVSALKETRRTAKGPSMVYIECPWQRCSKSMPGILWLRRDHESKAALVVGCGCGNTPRDLATLKDVLNQEEYSFFDFENADGKRTHESEDDFRERKRIENKEIMDRLQKNDFKLTNFTRIVGKSIPF
jgi:hypothetical protein